MTFADGEEDCRDLEDIVEICFGAGAVLKELVLVAGEFVALLAYADAGIKI